MTYDDLPCSSSTYLRQEAQAREYELLKLRQEVHHHGQQTLAFICEAQQVVEKFIPKRKIMVNNGQIFCPKDRLTSDLKRANEELVHLLQDTLKVREDNR